ncbi:MAG: hypothetical protein ACLUOI_15465 [Eisenbergiella sp.]
MTGNVHYQAWIDSGGTLPFPEGESRGAFQDRCCAGLVRMAGICAEWERAEEKKGTGRRELRSACVVHGGTVMALLERFGTEGGDYYSYRAAADRGILCWPGDPEEIEGEIELSCIQPLVLAVILDLFWGSLLDASSVEQEGIQALERSCAVWRTPAARKGRSIAGCMIVAVSI